MTPDRQQEEMTLNQALELLMLLAEWEIENPAIKPAPPGWINDLNRAMARVQKEINRPAPGEFFLSAKEGRRRWNKIQEAA